MQTIDSQHFHDGRIRGSYVYMLGTDQEDPCRFKIGYSGTPFARLSQLSGSLPFEPNVLLIASVAGREPARRLERALHAGLSRWRVRAEWFAVTRADRDAFNRCWSSVFLIQSRPGWRLHWTSISMSQLREYQRQQRAARLRIVHRRGRAYSDAVAAGLEKG